MMGKNSEYDRLYDLYKNKSFPELEVIANSDSDDYVEEAKRVAKDILVENKQEYQVFNKNGEEAEIKTGEKDIIDEIKSDWVHQDMMEKKRASARVISIAWAIMIGFLIAGIFAFAVIISIDNKYIWIAVSLLLGCIGEGTIFFAVIYSLGHILKNNEKMNEKIDKLIERKRR